ncbi:hypothetical protein Tco_1068622 [Tanacetum coccineum]|uniref:Uncharacterized protein n=1 Tax=Tanacetum coccineum TaxID=301880 RepID=A0ABQ5HGR1_9ASTR
MVGRRTYDMVVEKWKTVRTVVVLFCRVYDSPKFKEITFPNFNQGSEGSSKRNESSGSSSFNTESGDANINLNTTVADEDEIKRMEVECREREVEATEYRAQQEDISVRQKAMMDLAVQFDNASAAKQDLRQAYEKCNDIPQETRNLIDAFLKRESDKDYEINLAMYRKAG